MTIMLFSVLFLVFFTSVDLLKIILDDNDNSTSLNSTSETYQINLDPRDDFHLFWSPDYDDESLLFELRLKTRNHLDWFALGFSERGKISNGDFCVLWFDRRGLMHFEVCF